MSLTHSPVKTRRESVMPYSALTWSYDADMYSTDFETMHWDAGNLKLSNGETFSISANTDTIVGTTYIYWSVSDSGAFNFGSAVDCVGSGIIPIGVVIENTDTSQDASYRIFQGPGLSITADNIATNTLSAISANMGTITAGVISGIEIYGSTITGGTIQTALTGQRIVLDGSLNRMTFYNSGGTAIVTIKENVAGGLAGIDLNSGTLRVLSGAYTTSLTGGGIQIYREDQTVFHSEAWSVLSVPSLDTYNGRFYTTVGTTDTGNYTRTGVQSEIDCTGTSNARLWAMYGQSYGSSSTRLIGVVGAGHASGSGTGIGGQFHSDDIGIRISYGSLLGEDTSTDYVDLIADGDGNLTIEPTGTTITASGIFNVSDSYYQNNLEIINPSGYQVGDFKTRSYLHFGHDEGDTAHDETLTIYPYCAGGAYLATTPSVGGVGNGYGYCIPRYGRITGIAIQFDVTNTSTDASLTATAYINNVATSVECTTTSFGTITDVKAYSTSNTAYFAAGDSLNVKISFSENAANTCSVDDIAILVEIES